jgi:hypothetical protein
MQNCGIKSLQDNTSKLIGWMGNMTVSNRALQGVIVA